MRGTDPEHGTTGVDPRAPITPEQFVDTVKERLRGVFERVDRVSSVAELKAFALVLTVQTAAVRTLIEEAERSGMAEVEADTLGGAKIPAAMDAFREAHLDLPASTTSPLPSTAGREVLPPPEVGLTAFLTSLGDVQIHAGDSPSTVPTKPSVLGPRVNPISDPNLVLPDVTAAVDAASSPRLQSRDVFLYVASQPDGVTFEAMQAALGASSEFLKGVIESTKGTNALNLVGDLYKPSAMLLRQFARRTPQ